MSEKQYNKNDLDLKKLPYDSVYTLKLGNYRIKVCPFCEERPWTGGITNLYTTKWTIECRNCGIHFIYSKCHIGGKCFRSKKDLVRYWNRE